jgi:hypothetical protein
MGRSLSELRPEVAARAAAVIEDAAVARIRIIPTSTGRSAMVQVATFAQGRVKDAGPADVGGGRRLLDALRRLAEMARLADVDFARDRAVTNNDGVFKRSVHQELGAWDFVIVDAKGDPVWDVRARLDDYKKVGAIIEAHGFVWGGRFQPIDEVTGLGWDPFHAEMRA